MTQYELEVLANYRKHLERKETADEVFALSRRARIWLDFHYHLGSGCSKDDYDFYRTEIKAYRDSKLTKISMKGLEENEDE